jgi:hypothetical protein
VRKAREIITGGLAGDVGSLVPGTTTARMPGGWFTTPFGAVAAPFWTHSARGGYREMASNLRYTEVTPLTALLLTISRSKTGGLELNKLSQDST